MHLTSIVTTLIISLLLSTIFPLSYCESHPLNDPICKDQPYNCGPLSNISYPFWGHNRPSYCGGGGGQFNLNCHHNHTTLLIGSQNFTVIDINTTDSTMRLKRTDLAQDVCYPKFEDTSLSGVFRYDDALIYNISIFYSCTSAAVYRNPSDLPVEITIGYYGCGDGSGDAIFISGEKDELVKEYPWLQTCGRHTKVPVDVPLKDYRGGRLPDLIDLGFPVIYRVVDTHQRSNTWKLKRKIITGNDINNSEEEMETDYREQEPKWHKDYEISKLKRSPKG